MTSPLHVGFALAGFLAASAVVRAQETGQHDHDHDEAVASEEDELLRPLEGQSASAVPS